jgi:hemerythrin
MHTQGHSKRQVLSILESLCEKKHIDKIAMDVLEDNHDELAAAIRDRQVEAQSYHEQELARRLTGWLTQKHKGECMAFIEWKNEMSVGVMAMDAQHRKLIRLINQLAEAMQTGRGYTVIEAVLNELVEDSKTHLAAEERLLSMNDYPEYATYKNEHTQLIQKMMELQSQFHKGKLTLSLKLMDFFRDWLVKHIQGSDNRYGRYLNPKGIS